MNILYTCDDNYVWLMGISVISLFENNQNINEITVYLLGEKVKDKNKQIYNWKYSCWRNLSLIEIITCKYILDV